MEPGIIIAASDLASVNPVTFKDVIIILVGLLGAAGIIVGFVRKPVTSITPQPLAVEITKALHEQFADRKEFYAHKEHCTQRHGQLFKGIEQAEKLARAEMLAEVAKIQADRKESMQKMDIRHQRMMFALGRIAERLNVEIEPAD